MVERVKENKDKILEYMTKNLEKYGPDKMNVEEIGKLSDAIKDMAEAEKACWEAEYYRSVTEAMEGSGYMPEGMGYNRGRMGYNANRDSMGRYSSRRGYDNMGYHDEMEGIRSKMQSAPPEEREKMKRELRQMLDM